MPREKALDPSEQYFLDEDGRICPVNQMGWCKELWKGAATFQDALAAIAVSVHVRDAFPADTWEAIPREEWRDMKVRRWLDIEDAFYLATGVDVRNALFRFQWGEERFFNMRPDFGFLSLTTDLEEMPINAVESAIRDELFDYGRETEALKRAIDAMEVDPQKLYPIEWWQGFWGGRGIEMRGGDESNDEAHLITDVTPPLGESKSDAPPSLSRRAETTYLNIIGAMLELMLSKSPSGKRYSVFDNQAAIIAALLGNNEKKPGISERTLEQKFAAAKRSLISD